MLEKNNLTKHSDSVGLSCQKALAETSKALKACSFYPEHHPLRRQIFDSAYQAVADLTGTGRASFVVQRSGFALADGEAIENNPATRALAQELFTRELQRVTFLPGISPAEFSGFLSLLTVPPQKITEQGGMAELLVRNGIRSVVVNQIDISAVYTRKDTGEAMAEEPADGAEPWQDTATGSAPAPGSMPQRTDLSIEEILALLSTTSDDEAYRKLSAMLLEKALPLKQEGLFDSLFTVVMAMVEQSADEGRSSASRGCARTVVQQLCLGTMTGHLLDHLEDSAFPHSESIYRILEVVGAEAVEAVMTRLFASGSKPARKGFCIALVRIGAPALPPLFNALKDRRWQVVYTVVAILGEMGNRGAVKGLALTLHHPDSRVRMETVRVLAKIGGAEATSLLLALLSGEDRGVALHAIAMLGQSRNQKALQPLVELVQKRDLLGKSHSLKKEALIAIGRIGDRRSLDLLFRLVRKRFWLAPGRRTELKLTAIEAIGTLGGEQARNFLLGIAGNDDELGRAAGAALQALRQRNEEHE